MEGVPSREATTVGSSFSYPSRRKRSAKMSRYSFVPASRFSSPPAAATAFAWNCSTAASPAWKAARVSWMSIPARCSWSNVFMMAYMEPIQWSIFMVGSSSAYTLV